MPSPKIKRVKCVKCNRVIGFDTEVTKIASCFECQKQTKNRKLRTLTQNYARVKKGPALDLPKKYHSNIYRSMWERNMARVFHKQKREFEFESENCEFKFTGYRRKPWGYLCDFYLPDEDIWVEVKGYFTARDRSKYKRLKKQYPPVAKKLVLVLSKSNKKAIEFYKSNGVDIIYYEDLKEEWADKIPAWNQ